MALKVRALRHRRYLPAIVLGVATVSGLTLSLGLVYALARLGGQSGVVCGDPPGLEAQLPQAAILLTCIGGFLVGGLSSRWFIRSRHRALVAQVASDVSQRRVRLTMLLTFAMVFFILTALMLFEAGTLYWHVWPITYYVRCANIASSPLSALGAGLYSFVAGRWLWTGR